MTCHRIFFQYPQHALDLRVFIHKQDTTVQNTCKCSIRVFTTHVQMRVFHTFLANQIRGIKTNHRWTYAIFISDKRKSVIHFVLLSLTRKIRLCLSSPFQREFVPFSIVAFPDI